MIYNIRRRELVGAKGDPSWPIPDYKYVDAGQIEADVIIVKGDIVDNMKVIEIRHENGGSTVVVDGRIC